MNTVMLDERIRTFEQLNSAPMSDAQPYIVNMIIAKTVTAADKIGFVVADRIDAGMPDTINMAT